MGSISPQHSNLPILDFSDFHDPATRLQFTHDLIQAFQDHGAVSLINHSLSPSTLSQAFSMSHTLFSLPQATKSLAPHPPSPIHHRGYSYPGQEKLSQYAGSSADDHAPESAATQLDLRESYEIGSETNTHEPNIWLPTTAFPHFRPWAITFYAACHALAAEILDAVAMGLAPKGKGSENEARETLRKCHDGYNNQLRLLHYPVVARKEVEEGRVARMPAHTDWSTMTMLFQDDCGGLEVGDLRSPQDFVPVPPLRNACVVTVGDLLMRWSNGKLKSTLHRVALPPLADGQEAEQQMTKARYSIPYFISPHPESLIECLPCCVDAEHPAKYEPVTQIAYNRMRMNQGYSTEATQEAAAPA